MEKQDIQTPLVEANKTQNQQPVRQAGCPKEKVSIDTKVTDIRDESASLSSPDGMRSEASSQYLDKLPLRESSSAFLASLTSASDMTSPLTSAFPSTDSLQSSEPGREDYGNIVPHRDSMIEMAISTKSQPVTSPNDSSVSGSTPKPLATDTPLPLTGPSTEMESASEYYNKLSTLRYPGSGTPSRAQSPSQSAMSTPGDHTRHSLIPNHELYSSGKHDEEYEQSHSRTPLLPPIDYPPPKETDQAVKDYSLLGNKLINQYEAIAKLGSGAHGTVKLGKDKQNNRYVAIKVVRRYPKKPRLGKHESPEDKVKKEVAVLKKAQHPHVVTLLEVIDDPRLEKVYLILEFVERGEIKWRKSADRDIANFEMKRMVREMAGNIDEAAETERLMSFNEYLLDRLHARSVTNSSASDGYHDDDAFIDYNEYHNRPIRSHHSSRPTSRPSSQPPSDIDISAIHTLRVPSRASSQRDAFSIEELTASIHGSHIEEEQFVLASDFERERWLKDEPSLEQQWTPAEEEYRFVPCLTLSEARDVFRDTVLGLEYLHFHGIIHRDIKPANLLWTKDYRVKISDFGVSYLGRAMSDEENDTHQSVANFNAELAKTVGTPAFYAPELCDPDLFDPEKNVPRPRIGPQIDVWALGITLYAMVYGRLAFWDQNEFTMYEKIARRPLFVPAKRLRGIEYEEGVVTNNSNKREEHVLMYEDVDDDLKDLIRRLLIKDPAKRISIREVKHHPWLLRGVPDPSIWVSVTDPEVKTQKIEISQDDLREAVVPRTFLGKVWNGLTSMTRGRVPSRRRAETSSKNLGKRISSSLSRSNTLNKDQRRSSLRGDEASILDVLRSTRDAPDHTPWQSTIPGSTTQHQEAHFPPPMQQVDSQGNLVRPTVKQSTTADSILTVRIRSRDELYHIGHDWNASGSESVGSSSSSLAKIMDSTKAATRRFTSKARGCEPKNDDVMSLSSRASSGDNIALSPDVRSLKPSLAVSPAIAAGHVELPPSLLSDSARSSPHVSPVTIGLASTDSFQSLERGRTTRKRASTATSTSRGYAPVGLDEFYRARPGGNAGASGAKATSPNCFLPLTYSIPRSQPRSTADGIYPPTHAATSSGISSLLTTGETITPAIMKQKQAEREELRHWQSQQKQNQQDRTQQQTSQDGGGDGSDEDEGIVMGGVKR